MARHKDKDRPLPTFTRAEVERARLAKDFYNAWIGERGTLTILGGSIDREREPDEPDAADAA